MYRFFGYIILGLLLVCSPASADTTHRVRKGETLSQIANAYNVSVAAIKQANNIQNANRISVGQTLDIPAPAPAFVEYTIRKGDTLSDVAKRHGISVKQLTSYNNIRQANHIRAGQVIRIPISPGSSIQARSPYAALSDATRKTLDAIRPKPRQWKHIVIHHTGTRVGTAVGIDRFHREERRMENGLAYHFLIGNGRGMGDGEIHVGNRWKHQLQGGHLSSYALNQVSIGICLVGDFQKTKPTRKQMEQLEALVRYLMERANVPASRVTTHTLIHPKHTLCPGRHFPQTSFKKSLTE